MFYSTIHYLLQANISLKYYTELKFKICIFSHSDCSSPPAVLYKPDNPFSRVKDFWSDNGILICMFSLIVRFWFRLLSNTVVRYVEETGNTGKSEIFFILSFFLPKI